MKRLDYIDTAKGICMLLIILGHCAAGTSSRENSFLITWIYSFHTTSFFIITGLLMEYVQEHKRPVKTVFLSNIKRLLIPYFLFEILYMVWYCVINGFNNFQWMILDILLLADWDYASWFLLVLFISKIITIYIRKLIKNQHLANLLLFSSLITGLFLNNLNLTMPHQWLYRLSLRSLLGVGFICIGSLFKRFTHYFQSIKVLSISICVSLIIAYANGLVSIFYLTFRNPILYVISAISGAVFVISLSTHIKNRFITFFGTESVTALGTHQIVLRSFPFKSIFLFFIITPITTLIMYCLTFMRDLKKHRR